MQEEHLDSAQSTDVQRQHRTIRRIGKTALFGLAKGVATAIGGAVVTAVGWWIDHQ